jgi:hypothetical protein
MTNYTDLTVDTLAVGSAAQAIHPLEATQTLTGDGAITIKNGTVILNKGSAITATLANPTNVTDDFKELQIISITAQAHTVAVTGGYGNGGSGKVKSTFGTVVGNNMRLVAFGGYWYVVGGQGYTLGIA